MELKADNIDITLGVLIDLERIVGTEKIIELTRTQSTDVSFQQKLELMKLLGYREEECVEAPVELLEAELSVFFSRWLEKSIKGKVRSLGSPHLPGKSARTSEPSARSSTRKSSSRKTGRTR